MLMNLLVVMGTVASSPKRIGSPHHGAAIEAGLSPDGEWLATWSTGDQLQIRSARTLEVSRIHRIPPVRDHREISFEFSPDSRLLLVRIASEGIRVLDSRE